MMEFGGHLFLAVIVVMAVVTGAALVQRGRNRQ